MPFRDTPDAYTKVPTRTPADTIGLIRALLGAAPSKLSAEVKRRLSVVREAGVALQAAWIAAARPKPANVSKRVYDARLDRGWRIVRARNLQWSEIEDAEHGDRAAQTDALLFPTGLDFLGFKFAKQWAESEKRLALIDEDGLEAELVTRVGARYMSELREAHADYGRVLGITHKAETDDSAVRVAEELAQARRVIGAYARLVYTLAEDGDEEVIAAAEVQLEPILRFRQPRASAESTEGADAQLEDEQALARAPLPELPDAA